MSTKVLLVPGTGGTTLLKNGVSLGHPKVINARLWLFDTLGISIEDTVRDMSMSHRRGQLAPTATTLAPNAAVTAGSVLTAAYNLIRPAADEEFAYDWRGDIELSAQQLLELLKQKKPRGGRWKIVNHSQGGLVTLVASKLAEAQDGAGSFSELVSHITFVAVPVYGTLNAAHALLVGEDLGSAASPEFKRIAGTWPALYQMLPDFRALKAPDGTFARHTFLHTATYAPFPWIDLDLVRRAHELRAQHLKHPLSALQNVAYAFLFGTNKPTWEFATRHPSGEIAFGPKQPRAGDGLVPSRIMRARADTALLDQAEFVAEGENTAEHAMVLTDDFFATRTRSIFA